MHVSQLQGVVLLTRSPLLWVVLIDTILKTPLICKFQGLRFGLLANFSKNVDRVALTFRLLTAMPEFPKIRVPCLIIRILLFRVL